MNYVNFYVMYCITHMLSGVVVRVRGVAVGFRVIRGEVAALTMKL